LKAGIAVRWLIGAVVAATVLVLLPVAASAATNISIKDGAANCGGNTLCYAPASASSTVGTDVVWTSDSSAPHTVTRCSTGSCPVDGGTGTDRTFTDSPTLDKGQTFKHAFTAPGTYVYFCQIHGYAAMHGTVTISGSTTTTSGSSTTTTTAGGSVPRVSVGDVAVPEGDAKTRNASFPVTLSKASTQTVTVSYATANGTASAPGDYTAKSGTLSFAAGKVTGTVTVPVKGDVATEGDETFAINLAAPTNATVGDGAGTATIRNDDPGSGLRLAVGDVTLDEGNAKTQTATFTVSLSSPAASTVTVAYATANGTATAPGDYTAKSGSLTFNPGVVNQKVTVTVRSETVAEADETFTVVLSNPTGGPTIADPTGVGTIRNDD
jgi:plastocyanin